MTAYISGESSNYVWITADSSGNRRSRASQIAVVKHNWEAGTGKRLTFDHASYSETHGFLARSEFRYKIGET